MAATTLTKTLSNGVQIPWIAFGTGTALYSQAVDAPAALAIQTGFTHLDGAQIYNNEDSLGTALARFPRATLFVTTKLGSLKPGETVRASLQGSLRRLGVEYVDLWLIHTPAQLAGRLREVWRACEEVHAAGLARSIGVSNFTVQHLEEIMAGASVVPHVNQIELHPYVLKAAQPLLEFHKKHNITTESFGGLVPLTRARGGPLDPVLQDVRARVEERRGAPVTDSQVLIKWLEARNVVVVTTSSKESRLKEYLDAANVPALTPQEVQAIDEAGSRTHYRRFAAHMDK